MQILNCNVGNWAAQARISEAGKGKLLASIMAVDHASRARMMHTVVFDRSEEGDGLEQTAALVHRLLKARGG